MTNRQSGSQNQQSNSQPGRQQEQDANRQQDQQTQQNPQNQQGQNRQQNPNQQNQQNPQRPQGQQGAPTGVGKGGLGNQVNQGQAQQNPRGNPSTGQQTQQDMGGGGQQRGSMNKPGDSNESGSAGATRRDDGGMGKGN